MGTAPPTTPGRPLRTDRLRGASPAHQDRAHPAASSRSSQRSATASSGEAYTHPRRHSSRVTIDHAISIGGLLTPSSVPWPTRPACTLSSPFWSRSTWQGWRWPCGCTGRVRLAHRVRRRASRPAIPRRALKNATLHKSRVLARADQAVMAGGSTRRKRAPSGRGCQKETLARQIRQSSRSARSTAVRRRAFSGFPPGDTGACGRGCGARAGRMTASDARGGSSLTLRRAQRALRRAVMARPPRGGRLPVMAVASFVVRDGVDAGSCPSAGLSGRGTAARVLPRSR
jgi:hypothetical protein